MKNEAKEALKDDLKQINSDIARIEADYVTCKECRNTHTGVDTILADINRKLDLLIEKAIKG